MVNKLSINFLVKGSQADPYEVIIKKKDNNISAKCNCAAGKYGQFCKHRIEILEGSVKNIVSDNVNDIEIVKEWFKGSDVELWIKKLRTVEKEFEEIKENISIIKKNLSKSLLD